MAETRRNALKRIGFVLGGLAGALAGREALAKSGASRSPGDGVEVLTLEGRGWHIHSRDFAKGMLPSNGDRMTAYGALHSGPESGQIGDFFATYVSVHRPGSVGPLASLEHHTFNLPGGSIMGSGSTRPGFATEDEFAIVGGTGRYAAARGTYTVRQSHYEFGGDGSATIVFRLIKEGAS